MPNSEDHKSKIHSLLIALKDGDNTAMEELYLLTSKPLFSLCYSFFKNGTDSEDALHTAYLKIRQGADKYKGKNAFAFVYTITKNVCLNVLKKEKRSINVDFADEKTHSVFGEFAEAPTIDDESGIFALAKEILSDGEFKVVTMHAVGKIKFKDVAKILGGLEATVRWQYNNALKKLRKEFIRRNGDE